MVKEMLYLARYLNFKLPDKKVTWQWSASPPSSPSRILVDRDWTVPNPSNLRQTCCNLLQRIAN